MLRLPVDKLSCLEALQLSQCCLEITATCRSGPATSTARPGAAQFISLAVLTALSRLELNSTSLDLSKLGSCTGLRHLDIDSAQHIAAAQLTTATEAASRATVQSAHGLIAAALPNLTQLTYLAVRSGARAVMNQLSTLPNLQELQIGQVAAEDLAHLPTGLVSVWLSPHQSLTRSSVPQLLQLTRLQQLNLKLARVFDPELLHSITQLTWLCLRGTKQFTSAAVEGLMAGLQQLKLLQHLDLGWCLSEESLDAAAYAALTASSHLTYLDITDCRLPPEANDHMFTGADALGQLRVLIAPVTLVSMPGSFVRLVVCCPALEQLEVKLEEEIKDQTYLDVDIQVRVMARMLVSAGISHDAESISQATSNQSVCGHGMVHAIACLQGISALTRLQALTQLSKPENEPD